MIISGMVDTEMTSTIDIVITIAVSLFYLLIIPFQLVVFPMKYYSVKDVIYSGNLKKATGALITRFLFIFFVCLILWLIKKRDSTAIWGVTIGSILCTWPSIYQYQLYRFIKNKYKMLYFVACIVSVIYSWASAKISIQILLPVIFENKGFFLIDNSGISTIVTLFGFVMPTGVRKIIKEEDQDNPYLVGDTFAADMYLTRRKIQFEEAFFDQYRYEIDKIAEKYDISPALLTIVIQLEKINRGTWRHYISEKIMVRFFPNHLIKKNATLGLAQINIKTAHGFFHMAPSRYLKEMLIPEKSIELCAYILKDIIEEYSYYTPSHEDPFIDLYEDNAITDNYKCGLYIASTYICGISDVFKKYTLVYAELINEVAPVFYPENG